MINETFDLINHSLAERTEAVGVNFEVVDMRSMMRVLQRGSLELETFLSPKERQRLDMYTMPKKKVQWISGRYAVKTALAKHMGMLTNLKLCDIDVVNGENSAPYLLQFPELHISITHSFPWCIGVVANQRIGVDLEKVTAMRSALIKMYFHPREIEHLSQIEAEDRRDTHSTVYWTRKEAISKLVGLGMAMGFKELNTFEDTFILKHNSATKIRVDSFVIDRFVCSLASEVEVH